MELLLTDAIAPFFKGYKNKRINWSKIPFSHLETGDGLNLERTATITRQFVRYVGEVAQMGYNAITLDDLAHIADWSGYDAPLRALIAEYRRFYRELFRIANAVGLRVFLTTDVMFYTPEIENSVGHSAAGASRWLAERLDRLFADIPEVAGIIVRCGESDGCDVKDRFRSRLMVRTSAQARLLLRTLLPVFERHDRLLIFRTWTVGAYPLGDLIWHRVTFRRVFGRINSPSLVLSMKYGETDFYRYLPLNRHFFRSAHRKIIEFQARREYEGFGEFPSYTGWDMERYLTQARTAQGLIGASVWTQTGGWGRFRRLTFLKKSSPWVELNAFVLPRIYRGASSHEALRAFCRDRISEASVTADAMVEFARQSDIAINLLYYIREFATKKVFFRRLRVPPQPFVVWDRILVNDTLRQILRTVVTDRQQALREGDEGLAALEKMRILALEHDLPDDGLMFQFDTFTILHAARRYFFDDDTSAHEARLIELKQRYRETYKRHYAVRLNFERSHLSRRHITWAARFLFREQRGYRMIDRLFLLRLLGLIHPVVTRLSRRAFPKYARRLAMGIDTVFR